MSSHSPTIITKERNRNDNALEIYGHRDVHLETMPAYTSSLFIRLRQLQNEIHEHYKQEKYEMNELNERFRHFVDRVQQLEEQNARYITQIVNIQRSLPDASDMDIEWKERYLHLQSDLAAANRENIDFGLEMEMFQLQSTIYQQLIDVEQRWKDARRLKLEQELNQSSLALNSLRGSNSDLGREVESLYAAREDAYQQYLIMTRDWTQMKKRAKEWEFNLQLLKKQISFYENLRSYTAQSVKFACFTLFELRKFVLLY